MIIINIFSKSQRRQEHNTVDKQWWRRAQGECEEEYQRGEYDTEWAIPRQQQWQWSVPYSTRPPQHRFVLAHPIRSREGMYLVIKIFRDHLVWCHMQCIIMIPYQTIHSWSRLGLCSAWICFCSIWSTFPCESSLPSFSPLRVRWPTLYVDNVRSIELLLLLSYVLSSLFLLWCLDYFPSEVQQRASALVGTFFSQWYIEYVFTHWLTGSLTDPRVHSLTYLCKQKMSSISLCDLTRGLLAVVCFLLLSYIDPSYIYHQIRGQVWLVCYIGFINLLFAMNFNILFPVGNQAVCDIQHVGNSR